MNKADSWITCRLPTLVNASTPAFSLYEYSKGAIKKPLEQKGEGKKKKRDG